MTIQKRLIWVDVLRSFACICVLFCHSPGKYEGQGGQFLLAPNNYLMMAWGVSIFFMLSGALLFSQEQKLVPFYKKRLSRITMPIVIWSIIYILFDKLFITSNDDKSIIHKILLIPFYQQTGLLWFMYALIGIYLISPIISVWLRTISKKELEIILILWVTTLLLPYLELLDKDIMKIIGREGILNFFFGFVGYALWGYYLKTYIRINLFSFKYVSLVITSFIFPLIIYFTQLLPISVLSSSQSFFSALMSTIAFLFFKEINYKETKFIKFIVLFAEFSFGIYLCHMIFMRPIHIWLQPYHMHYALQIPITALITGILSFGFVWLLNKIPYSKFLFG